MWEIFRRTLHDARKWIGSSIMDYDFQYDKT